MREGVSVYCRWRGGGGCQRYGASSKVVVRVASEECDFESKCSDLPFTVKERQRLKKRLHRHSDNLFKLSNFCSLKIGGAQTTHRRSQRSKCFFHSWGFISSIYLHKNFKNRNGNKNKSLVIYFTLTYISSLSSLIPDLHLFAVSHHTHE